MKFTKPATTVQEQIALLKSRGLLFKEGLDYELILQNINYYRLGEYFYNFQYDKSNHLFEKDIYFENVYNIYLFDSELRKMIFHYISEIEISIRTKLIYHFSNEINPLWFTNMNNFYHNSNSNGISYAIDTYNRISDAVSKSKNKEVSLKTHYFKYNTDKNLPPAWKTFEYCTFGIMSNLYRNVKKDFISKQTIASEYGLKFIVLSNWLESINDLRNFCAHHSRLYNRNLTKYGLLLKKANKSWINDTSINNQNTNTIYYNLCIIKYLMNTINPSNKMNIELIELVNKYSEVDLKNLGFTDNWQKEDLWKLKLEKKKSKFIKDVNSTNNKIKLTLKG